MWVKSPDESGVYDSLVLNVTLISELIGIKISIEYSLE